MGGLDEAAPVTLGSVLLANEESLVRSGPSPVGVGNHVIDTEAMDGGFRYGEVTSIAGASGTGKTEVALIATTDPPLARLRDILVSRIRHHQPGSGFRETGYVYEKHPTHPQTPENVFRHASAMLDRVKLSRVFDFPGVAESVAEFGANLDHDDPIAQGEADVKERTVDKSITDSEDDVEEDFTLEGKESRKLNLDPSDNDDGNIGKPSPSMIIIDNLANVAGSTITKSQIQGHALLATFMRSLQILTRRRRICTLLINTVVGIHPLNLQYNRKPADQASIFASTPGKPALGKHFAHLVDSSILLSMLPLTREDADVAYGDVDKGRGFEKAGVIEVLKDRHGTREGLWSPFAVEAGIELRHLRI
ncbi:MAG: hypothetical protein Q9220_001898 [cf. Caloplaca sp. 1 TL-2023]